MKKNYRITWDNVEYHDNYNIYCTLDDLKKYIKKVKDWNPGFVLLKVEEVIENTIEINIEDIQ
jgi:hypothetical protein